LEPGNQTRVWDPLVRVVHWALACLVVVELFNDAGANPSHRLLGYAAAALVAIRLGWGLAASGYTRLSTMAASAGELGAYLRMARATRPYVGHNPLGALMAFTLWSLVLVVALTGWMLGLDSFWGDETVQQLHTALAYVLAALAVVHICGVLAMSRAQQQNLTKAMLTGNKSLPANR
jgi:cytochrome b